MQPKGVPHLLRRFVESCVVVDDHLNPLCRIFRFGAMLTITEIGELIGTALPECVMVVK